MLLFVVVLGNPRKWGEKPQRGTAPGKGDTVRQIHMPAHNSMGTSQTITIRHTKDPNKHAQAMMPAKARKKDKT
ncbi:hypothetical protein Q4555_00260 [Octadecabacter sp. 1_MG-2023]|uniref:hypothetical protein n=1 Tax=Octadecabacter sp. 1_MG-2023 TaxID=3062636 RepID=UPI0026E38A5C|nr:hypothetical protein [Octadecabacter sp. 1_MG-2023]MBU2993464.1 hypothetical protein [Octadecabacter sp. B2R22]MDO6733080.1 hypothetical protein [Octadecabacter sp. 1_MG-2023]